MKKPKPQITLARRYQKLVDRIALLESDRDDHEITIQKLCVRVNELSRAKAVK